MTDQAKKARKPKSPPRTDALIRVIKYLVIPFLCLFALFGGLIIGYVYIGNQDMADVFKWDTWKHVYDLVFADQGSE